MAQFIRLETSYKDLKVMLFFGIVLAPIGIGIVILYLTYKTVKYNYWEIHPTSITVFGPKMEQVIQLNSIISVELKQTKSQKKNSIGDLTILTNSRVWDEYTLNGVYNAPLYAESIQLAIDTIKAKTKPAFTVRPEEHPDIAIGGLDRMNDLVGLWQAGMISDEDFYAEQEKFKRDSST